MTEEAYPEAAAILRDAGWAAHPEWGVYTRGTLVMGGFAGSFHVKDYARIQPGHPQYSAHTPDTAEEAAAWLVARFANPLATAATLEPITLAEAPEAEETPGHESDGETGETPDGGEQLLGADAPEGADVDDGAGDGVSGEGAEVFGPVDLADVVEPIDADFTIEDLGSEDLLTDDDLAVPALEGADVEPEPPPQDGPIAYGASTIDGLIREKLGRVSQIARELKAVQQDGWTVEEYAYLQNLIVRMDRGEAPDDQASRERFLAIAAKSQAMSRIDAVRDRKEGELEEIGQRRDFDAAVYYEPEAGWP